MQNNIKTSIPELNLNNIKISEKSNHLNISDDSSDSDETQNETARRLGAAFIKNNYVQNVNDFPQLRKRGFSMMPEIEETQEIDCDEKGSIVVNRKKSIYKF